MEKNSKSRSRKKKKDDYSEEEEVKTTKKKKTQTRKKDSESEEEVKTTKKKTQTPRKKKSDSKDDESKPKKKKKVEPSADPAPNLDIDLKYQDDYLSSVLAFDPSSIDSKENFVTKFQEIADVLMNQYILFINGHGHRLAELEFYFCGDKHNDTFTHQDDLQASSGNWYFHKTGSGYKGGSYKGLDITFGQNGYGGILIRAIETLDGEYTEGPSLTVDRILSLNGAKEISDYVDQSHFNLCVWRKSTLSLQRGQLDKRELVSGPRVGLTLTKMDDDRLYYIMKPYRFVCSPRKVKKGKQNLVLGLIAQGKSKEDIYSITGSAKATTTNYLNEIEEGKKKTIDDFKGQKLSTTLLNHLAGYCMTLK